MGVNKRLLAEQSVNKPLKWRRVFRACLNCRTRKIKCDLGPVDQPNDPPCVRCKRERKECIFTEYKRNGGRSSNTRDFVKGIHAANSMTEVSTITIPRQLDSINNGQSGLEKFDVELENVIISSELTTMQNALEFLAKAAGSVAKEDARDLVDASTRYHQLEVADQQRLMSDKNILDSLVSSEKIGTNFNGDMSDLLRTQSSSQNNRDKDSIPLVITLSNVRPRPSKTLEDIEYIGVSKILTENEAIKLIDLFFLTMHPFFPHIPLQLHNSDELAHYPILLCAILTISSRYHPFDEIGLYSGEQGNRNIEIHERLWIYCQRLISQTIWAEASTRSLGTILAFLLFTEWNPRAIHWRWSDYANNPNLNDICRKDINNISQPQRTHGDGLTGLGAMRRSDRMSWMLTGTAVRLAQDMGFMGTSSKIFVATHISEIHTSMNMNQRSILSQSLSDISLNGYEDNVENEGYYLEKILKNDSTKERWTQFLKRVKSSSSDNKRLTDIEREFLNDEYVLYYFNKDEPYRHTDFMTDRDNSTEEKPYNPKFSFRQRAKIELLRIMSIGYETIYTRKIKLYSNDQRHNLAVLGMLSPLIEGWYNTYKSLLKPCGGQPCNVGMAYDKTTVFNIAQKIDGESLICDYYYCQLYIYSLALQMDRKISKDKLKLNEITKSARYVELAYNAAKEILSAAIRVHKLKLLKYMPVRWVTRIVRSVAFVVKCYLTLTGSGILMNSEANTILALSIIPTEEITQTIQRAAITLREASPDELHLCTRYSTILMYLCTEMKMRNKPNMQPPVLRSISEKNFGKQEELLQEETKDEVTNSNDITTESNDFTFNVSSSLHECTNFCLPTKVVNWFSTSEDIGLDFVEPWTEMIEQQFINKDDNNTFENLYSQAINEGFK